MVRGASGGNVPVYFMDADLVENEESDRNLTNQLYAEFSNATFFRPEPGRTLKVNYRVKF